MANRVPEPPPLTTALPVTMEGSASRRDLLGAVGTAAFGGSLTGCFGTQRPPHLGGGQVFNGHEESHKVAVLLERENEIVHWRHSSLAPNGQEGFGYTIERTWPKEPASFTVSAMRDGEQWRRTALREPVSADNCAEVYVFVNGTGQLVTTFKASSESEYYCSSGDRH